MKGMDLKIKFWKAQEDFLFLPDAAQTLYSVKFFFATILMKGMDIKFSFWHALEGFLVRPEAAQIIIGCKKFFCWLSLWMA